MRKTVKYLIREIVEPGADPDLGWSDNERIVDYIREGALYPVNIDFAMFYIEATMKDGSKLYVSEVKFKDGTIYYICEKWQKLINWKEKAEKEIKIIKLN